MLRLTPFLLMALTAVAATAAEPNQVVPVAALAESPTVDGNLSEWGSAGWVKLPIKPSVPAADRVNLPSPDHLREGDAKLGRAHRPGHRKKHAPSRIEEFVPALRRVDHGGGVEMAVVPLEELGDGSGHSENQLSK